MINEKRISKGFWVWGQFDSKATELITHCYSKANEVLKGPSFDVHLTLSGPMQDLNSNQNNKLNKLVQSLSPITLQLKGIGMKEQFFQSLFINVINDISLINLKSQIDSKLNLTSKNYFPHISLYYGNAEYQSKLDLVDGLEPPEEVFLDKISIVKVDESIKSWKVLDSFSLSGHA